MQLEMEPIPHVCTSCNKSFSITSRLVGYWTASGDKRVWNGKCLWCNVDQVAEMNSSDLKTVKYTGDAQVPNFSTPRDLWTGAADFSAINYHKTKAEQELAREQEAESLLGKDWKRIKEYAHQYKLDEQYVKLLLESAEQQGITIHDMIRKIKGK
jgi:hypothetical protein